MSNLLRKILANSSTRVLILLFVALISLIAYFVTHSYFVQLDIHKSKILSRLQAVARTSASQIDANQLEYLFEKYELEDEIISNSQVGVYRIINERLAEIKEVNELSTAIYTLTYDSTRKEFFFGVSSEDRPFYRHIYEHFPPELIENYNEGGIVDVYEDQNGHWLSAFYPIKNKKGSTIAIVQADNRFDEFIEDARQEIFLNIGIAVVVFLIIIFLLVRSMRSILVKEDKLTANLLQSKLELEIKNKETLDSILYAKRIQEAILPLRSKIKKALPESFIFHLPRDIVSGDFFWFKQQNGKTFIASVDCTGHGVPGAFMSMIGTILLDDIVEKKGIEEPDEILNELDRDVVKALKQDKREMASRDGMDIAICVIDEKANVLKFSGAFRPLLHIRNSEINRIKSSPYPIGGFKENVSLFEKHEIALQKGDRFYIYSDGYADQFGGERNKKYMTKRFRELILQISSLDMPSQEEKLKKEFDLWSGGNEQVDDVLVIGFKV